MHFYLTSSGSDIKPEAEIKPVAVIVDHGSGENQPRSTTVAVIADHGPGGKQAEVNDLGYSIINKRDSLFYVFFSDFV